MRPTERIVLAQQLEQLISLLEPDDDEQSQDPLAQAIGIAESAIEPSDPALKRLLPNAYRHEPELSTEFRRYTERELRESKIARAQLVLDSLRFDSNKDSDGLHHEVGITLDRAQAEVWVMSLADVRISIGAQLGLYEAGDTSGGEDQDEVPERVIYDWLTWVQGSLLEALQNLSP